MVPITCAYIFATASPSALACVVLVVLELIEAGDERRAHLQQLITRLRAGLASLSWPLLDSQTLVQALVVRDNPLALDLMAGLRAREICFRQFDHPPCRAIPRGCACR